MGANLIGSTSTLPYDVARAEAAGLVAWFVGLYALLGISAGRIRFDGWAPTFPMGARPVTLPGMS